MGGSVLYVEWLNSVINTELDANTYNRGENNLLKVEASRKAVNTLRDSILPTYGYVRGSTMPENRFDLEVTAAIARGVSRAVIYREGADAAKNARGSITSTSSSSLDNCIIEAVTSAIEKL